MDISTMGGLCAAVRELSLSISSESMELSDEMFVNYRNSIHGMPKLGWYDFY